MSQHLVRVYSRANVGGIIISSEGYTEPAITVCREALVQKVCVLSKLAEIVRLLEGDGSLSELLRVKIQAAIVEKNPLFEPNNVRR